MKQFLFIKHYVFLITRIINHSQKIAAVAFLDSRAWVPCVNLCIFIILFPKCGFTPEFIYSLFCTVTKISFYYQILIDFTVYLELISFSVIPLSGTVGQSAINFIILHCLSEVVTNQNISTPTKILIKEGLLWKTYLKYCCQYTNV